MEEEASVFGQLICPICIGRAIIIIIIIIIISERIHVWPRLLAAYVRPIALLLRPFRLKSCLAATPQASSDAERDELVSGIRELVQSAMKSRSDAIMNSGVVSKQVALGTPPPAFAPSSTGGGKVVGGGGEDHDENDGDLSNAVMIDLVDLAEEYTCEVLFKPEEDTSTSKVLASEKHIRQILEAGKAQREKYQMMVVQVRLSILILHIFCISFAYLLPV
jgi:hypothetical protein